MLGGAWRQWVYAGEVIVGCAIGSHWGINGVAVGASLAIVLHMATICGSPRGWSVGWRPASCAPTPSHCR